jgi:hypothetical protein
MPQANAKTVGRPKVSKGRAQGGRAKGRLLGLRLSNEEDRKFTLAAKANRKTMSQWIRGVLNAELEILAQKAYRDDYSAARSTKLIES